MRPYFMTTERLGFGTWGEDDLPLALALWGDPEVTRLIGGPFDRATVAARIARERATQAAHAIQYWPVFLRESGAHVGCCGLRPHHAPDVPELGFHLHAAYWRQGFGREAAARVVRHAFEDLGARALFTGHHPDNAGSRALILSLGFVRDGADHYPQTGLDHPSYRLDRVRATTPR
ncbi:MAG: N-acetyltransferase [Deltaproteobacteria bacterium]|nr:MAG: N-acetyltransferase [Deltaproteobacteria bacterium]